MTISELGSALGFREIQGDYNDQEITDGYTSDLLSDVMGNAPAGAVLITIQAHKNTVAVAGLVGMPAVLICNGRPIPNDMIETARNEGIALFSTQETQFAASVRIGKQLSP